MTARKKVLLAEDDADDRNFFQHFLQERQELHLLTPVENGVALMEVLDNIREDDQLPDIIILDQNMPKRNGLQTLALLKANQRYAGIPVMVYSTYADNRLINECVQTGAFLVVPKPSDKAGYHHMIEELLKAIPSG